MVYKYKYFTHNYYDHVKYIPDRSDVLHSPFSYFQSLFNDVINDEGDEDEFTRHYEIVPCFYVLQKFYGSKFRWRYNSTSCRKFKNNPSINKTLFQKWNITYHNTYFCIFLLSMIETIPYITMQNKLMFALYTVKSNETNLVPRLIHKPSFSSLK